MAVNNVAKDSARNAAMFFQVQEWQRLSELQRMAKKAEQEAAVLTSEKTLKED